MPPLYTITWSLYADFLHSTMLIFKNSDRASRVYTCIFFFEIIIKTISGSFTSGRSESVGRTDVGGCSFSAERFCFGLLCLLPSHVGALKQVCGSGVVLKGGNWGSGWRREL